MVAGTLRGHLGWWAGAGCGPAPGHGHSGHCIDDITIVSWKTVEISPDLTLFSKQTGRFRDLCYFLTKPPFGYDLCVHTMVFYPTIGSTYFVKTQTYVALFGPHQLSIIFSGVMYLELSSL